MTSDTAAEVAPDLKTCKVYISVFGDDEAKKETIRGLKSAEGFIRRMLAKTINLRNTPELTSAAVKEVIIPMRGSLISFRMMLESSFCTSPLILVFLILFFLNLIPHFYLGTSTMI